VRRRSGPWPVTRSTASRRETWANIGSRGSAAPHGSTSSPTASRRTVGRYERRPPFPEHLVCRPSVHAFSANDHDVMRGPAWLPAAAPRHFMRPTRSQSSPPCRWARTASCRGAPRPGAPLRVGVLLGTSCVMRPARSARHASASVPARYQNTEGARPLPRSRNVLAGRDGRREPVHALVAADCAGRVGATLGATTGSRLKAPLRGPPEEAAPRRREPRRPRRHPRDLPMWGGPRSGRCDGAALRLPGGGTRRSASPPRPLPPASRAQSCGPSRRPRR
jgi:hypothetical protein